MQRAWLIWIPFFLAVVVLLSATAWISRTVLELERSERQARRQAMLEENVRLALWRMDSTLSPVVAQESVRPPLAYQSFVPLGTDRSPWVLVDFQFGPDGNLSSPQIPGRSKIAGESDPAGIAQARERLAHLESLAMHARLIERLPQKAMAVAANGPPPGSEFDRRAQVVTQNTQVQMAVQSQAMNRLIAPTVDTSGVPMKPVWIDDELILARHGAAGREEYVEGCWFDWPAIRRSLLDDIGDLLPNASLEPVVDVSPTESRMLAALPVRLIPGELPAPAESSLRPAVLSLVTAWTAMLLAIGATAALLAGVVRLGERRAAFVSAVTHELRTPLTTFQLYSEMLAEGMVPEPERPAYLRTLRSEAERLAHLVENVLAYARLERGRIGGQIEELTVEEFLLPMRQRLADVASRAGMELVVEADDEAAAAVVRANRSSLEQILLNLVDNAAKYAARATDKRIHLSATAGDGRLEVRVWDHGPGVSPRALGRLFHPFRRSAREAAGSAPGVGVGLALSRRLARNMGSRLELNRQFQGGACFVITLPRA